MALNENLLYEIVGDKIRRARARQQPKMSQEKLAGQLGLTRASVVNIEAGRQHPPLHVLWQIAESLNTELALLLPSQDDYVERAAPVKLDSDTVAQIEEAANGDVTTRRLVTQFVSQAKSRTSSTNQ